jgi:hypothetical protein
MKKIIYLCILLTFLTSCTLPFGGSSAPSETALPAESPTVMASTATAVPIATEEATAVVMKTVPATSTANPEPTMTVESTDSVTATPSETPTATENPTATATPTNTATPTITPSPTLSSVGVTNRCNVLSGVTVTFITLEWVSGEPLTFYFKMPGGVPGLEKAIPGDSGVWGYYVTIRHHRTEECKFIPGYEERLYCKMNLPSTYAHTRQVLDLFVNGCDTALYHDPFANMPKMIFPSTPDPYKSDR